MRAELTVQRRRLANWLLIAVGGGLTVAFAYAVPYAAYRRGNGGDAGALEPMLPADFSGVAIGGLPAFVGALALIFGVLVAGSNYMWETWKTILVQQPRRVRVLAGKVVFMALGVLGLVGGLLLVSAVASGLVAWVENADASYPPPSHVVRDLGAGWLVGFTWAALGAALAIVLRGVSLPIGLGLVWMLAVQNLITVLAAPVLGWVDAAQQWLPGTAAGSLVASVGGGANAPGVVALISGPEALVVLVAYSVVALTVAALTLNARDLT